LFDTFSAPAHIGVEGNEQADEAAKEATRRGEEVEDTPEWTSLAFIRRNIGHRKRAFAKQTRENMPQGSQYRSSGQYDETERQEKRENKKTGKVETVRLLPLKSVSARLAQLRTGHMVCGEYLKRIQKTEDDSCGWCREGVKQTRDHLVLGCKMSRSATRDHLLQGVGVKGNRDRRRHQATAWTAKKLLKKAKPDIIWSWLEATEVGKRTSPLDSGDPNTEDPNISEPD
jgi:hypothetical protein